MITEPCFVLDMDEATYHADPCPDASLSSTMAKTLLTPGGPARVRHQLDHPREATNPIFNFGHAAHEKALGRGAPIKVIDGNRNTKDVKAAISEAEAAGFTVLKPEDAERVEAMADAILANALVADLLTTAHGQPEVSMFGIDPDTGRWLRGRLDFLASRSLVVDYKTAGISVDTASWTRQSWTYGYHIQAAHYLSLAVGLDLVDPDAEFWFIAQEKTAPHLCGVFRLDPDLLAEGHAQVRRAIDLWDRCLTTNEWPGLPTQVQTIRRPRWATTEEED